MKPQRTVQPRKSFSLWRTPWQTFRWNTRRPVIRAIVVTVLAATIAGVTWWQAPALTSILRAAVGVSPAPTSSSRPIVLVPSIAPTTMATIESLRSQLTEAVGAAGAVISAKQADGIPATKIAATRTALKTAQGMLDDGTMIIPALDHALSTLKSSTAELSRQKPSVKTAPSNPPVTGGTAPSQSSGNLGSTGKSNGAGSTGGSKNSSPPKSGGGTPVPATATTSSSLTCNGTAVSVTFIGTGGGTVRVSVSGPARGYASGSGSATAVAHGPGGTYTASASATGSVGLRGYCG